MIEFPRNKADELRIESAREYIAFLEDGVKAAHEELDKAGIERETVEWEGPIQHVTEYPVCDRIRSLVERLKPATGSGASTVESVATAIIEKHVKTVIGSDAVIVDDVKALYQDITVALASKPDTASASAPLVNIPETGSLQHLPESGSGSSVSSSGDDWKIEAENLALRLVTDYGMDVSDTEVANMTREIAALCVRAAGTNEVEAALKELRELFPLLTHSILIHDSKRRAEVIISCGGIQQSRGYTLVEAMACVRAEEKGKLNSGAPKP